MPGVLPLLAALMGISVGYVLLRRTLRRFPLSSKNLPRQPSFDAAELHSMFANGLVSDEEYERLKAILVVQQSQHPAVNRKSGGFEVIPVAKVHSPPTRPPTKT